jgi:hypothetical protein
MFCAKVCHSAKVGLDNYWGLTKLDALADIEPDVREDLLLREKQLVFKVQADKRENTLAKPVPHLFELCLALRSDWAHHPTLPA